MTFIWATRGRDWGFRFLASGGFPDPLMEYTIAFDGLEGPSGVQRDPNGRVALRFPDPQGRRDFSGRVIPHEFVVYGPLADGVDSVESGEAALWPLVELKYERVWNQPAD